MIEYRLNEEGVLVEVDSNLNLTQEATLENVEQELSTALPVEQGFWGKFKGFLFQEINLKEFLFQEINMKELMFKEVKAFDGLKINLTPYEKKVFGEVKDFWTQDVKQIFKF